MTYDCQDGKRKSLPNYLQFDNAETIQYCEHEVKGLAAECDAVIFLATQKHTAHILEMIANPGQVIKTM